MNCSCWFLLIMNFGAGMRCFLENVASVSAAHLEHEGFRYVQED